MGVPPVTRVPKLLILEDSEDDAALIIRLLELGGLAFTSQQVTDEGSFRQALTRNGVDLILADFVLPAFDALAALRIVRDELHLDIPVIVVTGYLSEERARDFKRRGAAAYLSKDDLDQLPAMVRSYLAP